jgi:hypothetical protein
MVMEAETMTTAAFAKTLASLRVRGHGQDADGLKLAYEHDDEITFQSLYEWVANELAGSGRPQAYGDPDVRVLEDVLASWSHRPALSDVAELLAPALSSGSPEIEH